MIIYKIEVDGKPDIEFTYNSDETIINIPDESFGGGYTTVDTNELIKVLCLIKKDHTSINKLGLKI